MATIYQQSNTHGQNNNEISPTSTEMKTLVGLHNTVGRRLGGIQRKGGIVRCQGTINLNLRRRLHSLGLDSLEAPVKPTIFQNRKKFNDTYATTNQNNNNSNSRGRVTPPTVSVPRGFIGRQISDITTISEKEFYDGLSGFEEVCQIVRLEI